MFNLFKKKNVFKYDFIDDIKDAVMFIGLNDDEVKQYQADFIDKFGISLPDEVGEFLKITNGIYKSDMHLFSKFKEEMLESFPRLKSKNIDIIEFNDNYRMLTDIDDYIILGKDNISYFVYDINNKKHYVLSSGCLEIMNEYDELYIMIKEIVTGDIYK